MTDGTAGLATPARRSFVAAPLWRRRPRSAGWLVLVAGLVLVLPETLGSDWDSVGTNAAIWAIAAIGLDLMWGLAGQVSLGQQGFMALSAYGVAIATVKWELGVYEGMAIAVLATVVAALVIGLIVLRLQETYLALATLGFGLMVTTITLAIEYTGQATGIYGIPALPLLETPRDTYLTYWGIALAVAVVGLRVLHSTSGLSWRVIAHNEDLAQACGANTTREKQKAFVLGAALTGLAGGLLALDTSAVSPATFNLDIVLILVISLVVGGRGSIVGGVIGAMGVSVALMYSSRLAGWTDIAFAGGFVVALKLLPGGLIPTIERVGRLALLRVSSPAAAPRGGSNESSGNGGPALISGPRRLDETVLSVDGVSKHFRGLIALEDVSLRVSRGEIHGIVGPNGAGKSTMLAVVSGLLRADTGRVHWRDRDISDLPAWRRSRLGIARSFQVSQLVPDLTVRENVALGLYVPTNSGLVWGVLGRERARQAASSARVDEVLDHLGLARQADLESSELSFGQLRLAELARCLVRRPDLLLLDEAASGLDGRYKELLVDEIRALAGAGTTLCLIEHDTDLVSRVCDEVTVLDAGQVLSRGTGRDIFRDEKVQASYMGRRRERAALMLRPPTALVGEGER